MTTKTFNEKELDIYQYAGTLEALLESALEYGKIIANPDQHEWYEVNAAKIGIDRVYETFAFKKHSYKRSLSK